MHHRFTKAIAVVAAAATTLLPVTPVFADHDDSSTNTPIKHLVIIFQENVSLDHYFATYPFASNPPGEPAFHARENTPTVNNLLLPALHTNNANLNAANGAGASRCESRDYPCPRPMWLWSSTAFVGGLTVR